MRKIVVITFILSLFSCTKEELGPQCVLCETEQEVTPTNTDVLIVNEGSFGNSAGTISLYQPPSKTVSNNLFSQTNGTVIGSVAQSAYQIDNKAYIVVNNSNKIEVIDINDFKSLHTITGFNSPRYFLPINQHRAYVTDLYSNSIQIVDLNNNSITGNIPVQGWTEELLLHNDTVYVCDMTNNNLLIIDPNTNTLVDSVKLGESPNSMVVDKDSMLWIMCDGGFASSSPQLIKFNPQTRTKTTTYTFGNVSESPSNLKINATGDGLYFVNEHLYKMSIYENNLTTTPLITSNGNTFYEIGIDPTSEEIYIADAIDYIQNGTVYRHSSTGELLHQFNAGVIPGYFLFVE